MAVKEHSAASEAEGRYPFMKLTQSNGVRMNSIPVEAATRNLLALEQLVAFSIFYRFAVEKPLINHEQVVPRCGKGKVDIDGVVRTDIGFA